MAEFNPGAFNELVTIMRAGPSNITKQQLNGDSVSRGAGADEGSKINTALKNVLQQLKDAKPAIKEYFVKQVGEKDGELLMKDFYKSILCYAIDFYKQLFGKYFEVELTELTKNINQVKKTKDGAYDIDETAKQLIQFSNHLSEFLIPKEGAKRSILLQKMQQMFDLYRDTIGADHPLEKIFGTGSTKGSIISALETLSGRVSKIAKEQEDAKLSERKKELTSKFFEVFFAPMMSIATADPEVIREKLIKNDKNYRFDIQEGEKFTNVDMKKTIEFSAKEERYFVPEPEVLELMMKTIAGSEDSAAELVKYGVAQELVDKSKTVKGYEEELVKLSNSTWKASKVKDDEETAETSTSTDADRGNGPEAVGDSSQES